MRGIIIQWIHVKILAIGKCLESDASNTNINNSKRLGIQLAGLRLPTFSDQLKLHFLSIIRRCADALSFFGKVDFTVRQHIQDQGLSV